MSVHFLDPSLLCLPLAQSLLAKKSLKLLEIAQIISQSVRRKIALDTKIISILFDQILHDWPLKNFFIVAYHAFIENKIRFGELF